MKRSIESVSLSLLTGLMFFGGAAYSQHPYPVVSMDVSNVAIADTMLSGLPVLDDSTWFETTMHVAVYDTTGIDYLEVKLGTTEGGSELLSRNFSFDVSGGLGDGTSYHRLGYDIDLGLGNYRGLLKYFAGLRIKRSDGTYTGTFTFSR